MCGRFTLRADGNALAQHFEMDAALAAALPAPRFNIAPTQAIPVIRWNAERGARELVMQRWGLVPHWGFDWRGPQRGSAARPAYARADLEAHSPKPALPHHDTRLPALFNARAETLAAKPAFREALRGRRCLIPADGFYEWKAVGKSKQPWFVHRPGDGVFAFAGLWEGDTCTIITRAPTPQMAALHDRMPAILQADDYSPWLDPARSRSEELLPLLDHPPELDLYAVRLLVNRAATDGPECVMRIR